MGTCNVKSSIRFRLLWIFVLCLMLSGVLQLQAQENSEEQYEAHVLAFIDAAYNNSDVSMLDSLFAADYAYHPGGFDISRLRINILSLRAAMPDLQATPIIHIAERDWVAVHLYLRGTFPALNPSHQRGSPSNL
jgi:hypothetical protein